MNLPTFLHPSPQQFKHALKTALAAVLAYIFTSLLGLPEGQWAVITVIVVTQTNLGSSLRVGTNRLIGTAGGAALGVAVLVLLGTTPLALGLGVGLVIFLCSCYVQLHDSFRMAGLTAAIIILGGHTDSFLFYGFTRFLEISVGVGVALAVSFYLWPARAGAALKHNVGKTLRAEADFFTALANCRFPTDCDPKSERAAKAALGKVRETNHTLLDQAKSEPAGFSKEEHLVISLFNFTERIAEHLLAMEHAVHFQQLEPLHGQVFESMEQLNVSAVGVMVGLADTLQRGAPLPSVHPLHAAMKNTESALSKLRRQRTLAGFNLETVMRFMTFYYNMREVAAELIGMADRAGMLKEE